MKPIVIGIAGGTASGKTSVVEYGTKLASDFGSCGLTLANG